MKRALLTVVLIAAMAGAAQAAPATASGPVNGKAVAATGVAANRLAADDMRRAGLIAAFGGFLPSPTAALPSAKNVATAEPSGKKPIPNSTIFSGALM